MKKYVLLFLALSSLSFADVTITKGKNAKIDGQTVGVGGATSASINIDVSATVTDVGPEIEIVDEKGNPVTAVNFMHELKAGNIDGQAQQELNTDLRVKTTNGSTGTVSGNFGSNTLTLTDTNSGNMLTANLASGLSPSANVNNNGTQFRISSTLSDATVVADESYSSNSTSYTITYTKTEQD